MFVSRLVHKEYRTEAVQKSKHFTNIFTDTLLSAGETALVNIFHVCTGSHGFTIKVSKYIDMSIMQIFWLDLR